MQRTIVRHLAALVLPTVLAACGAYPAPRPPWRVPEADVRAHLQTLCVLPLDFQVPLPPDDARRTLVEQRLLARLGESFRVVPPAETQAAMREAIAATGGWFDPHTGERDPARWEAGRPQAAARLRATIGCDATLRATVAVVSVPFSSGEVHWDGRNMPYGRLGSDGWTTGLSLWIDIRDLDDRELYFGTGGIEVVVALDEGFFSHSFTPAAPDQVLRQPMQIDQALSDALGPLLAAPAAVIPPA